ncbi:MAG TPA: hypothetical protein VNF73_15970 [Candidatus Saccharimonadales bacterium]|nr:hypothetical protein [Candidatus Saccharimonadales bacterium]
MGTKPMLTPDLVARIGAVKVADLADGCRMLGFRGSVAAPSMRPAAPYSHLIGTAVTVTCSIQAGAHDYGEQAARLYSLGSSVPFAVMIQRNDVPDFTSIGSGGARVARAHGYVGWVTSGPIRDTDELRDLGVPVYGTSIVPSGRLVTQMPEGSSIRFDFDIPVDIAGMLVNPGDVIVGDNDGLIALAPDRLAEVLAGAERLVRGEGELFERIDRGLTYRQILDAGRAGH